MDRVPQRGGHAQEDYRAPARKRAPAAGRRIGDAERVGQEADRDVVEASVASGGLPHERLLQRAGSTDEDALA
jgi:hypothetical protein